MSRRIVLVDIGNALAISGVLPSVALNSAYSARLTARGGRAPYTYTVSAGTLPTGLYLDPATGIIAGTATAAGTFALTVRATDTSGRSVQRSYAITVIGEPAVLTLTGTFAAATVGTAYSSDLTITNGTAPYTLHGGTGVISGTLPDGLALSIVGDKLRLSGTPTTVATSSFTVAVDSSDGQTATSAQSVAVAGASYDDVVLSDAPIGYWKLDEASGTVATDSSGNGRHGSYSPDGITQRAAAIRSGALGALDITALAGGVSIPHDPAFSINAAPKTQFAVELCLKPGAVFGNGQGSVFGKWISPGGGSIEWYVSMTNPSAPVLRSRSASADLQKTISTSAVHVIFERNGDVYTVYVNGAPVNTLTRSGNSSVATQPVAIGGFATQYTSLYGWTGTVSDAAIYDHVLGAAKALAHAQAGGFA